MKKMDVVNKPEIPEPFLFTNYEIILTWDCNLSCTYCYERNHGATEIPSGRFSPEAIEQLVVFILCSHATQASTIHLQFFGGEPVLCMDTIKVIVDKLESAFKAQFPTQKLSYGMTTNATAITRKDAKYFAQKGFGLLVSLDGPQQVHDRNRGVGTFELTMQRIAYLRALQVSLSIRMTVAKNTIADFANSFEFINSLELPFLWQLDTSQEYPAQVMTQFIQDVQKVYAMQRPVFDTTIRRFKEHLDQTGYCINPYRNISVRYDGSLVICSRVNWVLGDIWKGLTNYDKLTQISMYGGNFRPECSACLSLQYCKGGCLGEHVEEKEVWAVEYTPKKAFCLTQHIMQIIVNEELLQKQLL